MESKGSRDKDFWAGALPDCHAAQLAWDDQMVGVQMCDVWVEWVRLRVGAVQMDLGGWLSERLCEHEHEWLSGLI